VGSWCIRAPRRGQADPSALSLGRESKGYVTFTFDFAIMFLIELVELHFGALGLCRR
jgi:hypothetical protein